MDSKDKKDNVMSLRINDEQKRKLKEAAHKNGMGVSTYLIRAAENAIVNQEFMNKRMSDKEASVSINTRNVGVMQDFINNVCETVCPDHPEMCGKMEELVDEFWNSFG